MDLRAQLARGAEGGAGAYPEETLLSGRWWMLSVRRPPAADDAQAVAQFK